MNHNQNDGLLKMIRRTDPMIFNGWAFGNILLGGIIGWSVDLITNSVSKPAQDEYMIEPTFKRKVQNQKEME